MQVDEFHRWILNNYEANQEDPCLIGGDRIQFIVLLYKYGCKTGAEIGVYKGLHAQDLLKRLEGPIYLVDPWKHFPEKIYEEGNSTNPEQVVLDKRHEDVVELLKGFDNKTILRKESVEAVADIPNESLDFVYIDANHAPLAIWYDLRAWWPKVRRGGLMTGHDYNHDTVKKAVDAFVREKKFKHFYVMNGCEYFFPKE